MPFTIGEIPIGQIVDGEMVLRDVMVDMDPPGQYQPMPSTPTRGIPAFDTRPRQTTMALGEEDGGQMMPPPPPGGVPGRDFFLNEQGVQTSIQPIPQLPGGVRPPDYRTEAPKFTFPETTPTPRPVYGDLPSFLNAYGIGGLHPSVSGANRDPDEDGLVNGDEFSLNTDPTHPDTDSDGIPDGQEYLNGTNPLLGNGGKIWNPDALPIETKKGGDEFNPFDVQCADGTWDVSYGAVIPCSGHGGVMGQSNGTKPIEQNSTDALSDACLSNIVSAQEMMQIYDWKMSIYPIQGGGSTRIPPGTQLPMLQQPGMTADVFSTLFASLATQRVADALLNIYVKLQGAGAYAQTDNVKMQEKAIELAREVLYDARSALENYPKMMIPVSGSGEMMILDMETGKRMVALEYAYRKLKELESLLSPCGDPIAPIDCPEIASPLCPPDSILTAIGTSGAPCWTPNYACRPKFKQTCYNVSVPKGSGSGTETITKCEQVLMDANEWELMQKGAAPR